jgi:hypothetical protein
MPTCAACLYFKATRQFWRREIMKKHNSTNNQSTKPGQVVSVSQLVSPTPGLVAQFSDFLTTKRYKYATIYIDIYSRYGYVYLNKTASANESVIGKKAFEAYGLPSSLWS